MRFALRLLLACCAGLVTLVAPAQTDTYILNGSATQISCNCYTLTQEQAFQSGSVWNATKINLNNPFDFIFNVYLGCKDADGADGIVFMLQPLSTSVGTAGGGMGFGGVVPSLGVALDTWQNSEYNDPAYDHISIQINGNLNHTADLTPVQQALPTNPDIETCQWYTFRIIWDPVGKLVRTYFGGYFIQQANIDLVNTVFGGDPMVYWGFSGATGGSNNLQQFCTALNPNFNASTPANSACDGNAVTFTNTSQSFAPIANFYWDFGDGTTSTNANPPPHTYPGPGTYEVKLAITALDGCRSDTIKRTYIIGDNPVAAFDVYDTCVGKPPRIVERSQASLGIVSDWEWTLDGSAVSLAQNPTLTGLSPGPHTLQLVVKSEYGCASAPIMKTFLIDPAPTIRAEFENGCVLEPVNFRGVQLDNATFITEWRWQFGDNETSNLQNPSHVYDSSRQYTVQLTALGANGCVSFVQEETIFISRALANAGRDTIIVQNEPYQLQGSGGGIYLWTPAAGLSNNTIANPIAILQDNATLTLLVTNAEGCTDEDEVNIEVFKGSAIHVPTGFTPDNNGLNDILKPFYGGIKRLDYFSVYNRWGELIFTTKSLSAGWDGVFKGARQPTGVYVWMIQAMDYAGKLYKISGTTTIIR